MLRRLSTLALLLAAAGAPLSAADVYTFDKNHSEASFQIRHFVTKVRGGFDDFEGAVQIDPAKPESSSVTFSIKAASIDTRNADRDKDLRSGNFFDVEKFPEIAFKSTKIVPAGKDKYDVTGNLAMHGVTKELTLPVRFLGYIKDPWGNQRAGFELATTLNRKDYGINWNKALDQGGFMLGDDVEVTISLETVHKKAQAPAAR